MHLLLLFLCFAICSTQEYDSFQIYNRFAKKCLSFANSGGLGVSDCTRGLEIFFNWTTNRRLEGAYTGYKNKCIRVTGISNSSLTTGDCSLQDTVRWACEGNRLRPQSGGWYLSWNPENKVIEMNKTVNGEEGQWLLYETDNNICRLLPQTFSTTVEPFTQPSTLPIERHSAQLWPRGNFSLPKAASGCPGSTNFTWKEGWVFQDLDDTGEIKTRSSVSFNMAANIDEYGNIKRWFCTKNYKQDHENERPLWPKGTYCIYSSFGDQRCPKSEGKTKFDFGVGIWDNQYWINNSRKKGVLPRGEYVLGGRTHINFCCQSNEDPSTPISLPIDRPFYLLAYRSPVCQKVEWATVISEFIVYDTSDFNNYDYFSRYTPFSASKSDPKIYYCYYQGCNHTIQLDDKREGDIRFPVSPFMDITSQSCSWRILVPSDHVISINFTYFNIPSSQLINCSGQFVEILDGGQTAYRSVGTFCGTIVTQLPALISQHNSVLIVLNLGRNVTNTTGFRLNFKAISTQVTSTLEVKPTERSTPMSTLEVKPSERSTPMSTSEVKPTERSTPMSTLEVKPSERSTPTSNTKNNKSEENVKSTEPSLAKVTGDNVPTTSIVVPVAFIVLVGIVLVTLIVVRKRRKKENVNVVTFENCGGAQENPIYEGQSENEVHEDDNCKVTMYESIDHQLTRPNITVEFKSLGGDQSRPKSVRSRKDNDTVNPLYESSAQIDYSSNVNPLYASSDS